MKKVENLLTNLTDNFATSTYILNQNIVMWVDELKTKTQEIIAATDQTVAHIYLIFIRPGSQTC